MTRQKPIRFVDGEAEIEILRERYREKMVGLTVRERMCWELGFDYGVDDPGLPDNITVAVDANPEFAHESRRKK
jgi:hypothetical protein